jgi:hypothetical protein
MGRMQLRQPPVCQRRVSACTSQSREKPIANDGFAPAVQHGCITIAVRELFKIAAGRKHLRTDADLRGDSLIECTEFLHEHIAGWIRSRSRLQSRRGIWNIRNAYTLQQFRPAMLDDTRGQVWDGGELFHRSWHTRDDLTKRRILENPASRTISFHGASFTPRGQLTCEPGAMLIQTAQSFDAQPGLFGFNHEAAYVHQGFELFPQPCGPSETFELFLEPVFQWQEIPHIVERVLDLFRGQRTPRPVRTCMCFAQLQAQKPAYQLAIPNLRRQSHERRGNLRIEHRLRQTNVRPEHFEILPGCVHDLQRSVRTQKRRQGAHTLHGKRIDAHGHVGACQLDEAELRAIGAFAKKFSVEADSGGGCKACDDFGQLGFAGDNRMQR